MSQVKVIAIVIALVGLLSQTVSVTGQQTQATTATRSLREAPVPESQKASLIEEAAAFVAKHLREQNNVIADRHEQIKSGDIVVPDHTTAAAATDSQNVSNKGQKKRAKNMNKPREVDVNRDTGKQVEGSFYYFDDASVPGTPTPRPTRFPTHKPTVSPAPSTSSAPSVEPTTSRPTTSSPPTVNPTLKPTVKPTRVPTIHPSLNPTVSYLPTKLPTFRPSTFKPTTRTPTVNPTAIPSIAPSIAPTAPTVEPSMAPSVVPSVAPSEVPSVAPSFAPTTAPSEAPTMMPSIQPSEAPTEYPTMAPTIFPSSLTCAPSYSYTESPTTDDAICGCCSRLSSRNVTFVTVTTTTVTVTQYFEDP